MTKTSRRKLSPEAARAQEPAALTCAVRITVADDVGVYTTAGLVGRGDVAVLPAAEANALGEAGVARLAGGGPVA